MAANNPNAAEDGKLGGRPTGAKNKKTVEAMAKVEDSGMTPLEYMISVMRNESNEPGIRMDAAKSAAPYVHAKLTHNKNDNSPVTPEDIGAAFDAALEYFESQPKGAAAPVLP